MWDQVPLEFFGGGIVFRLEDGKAFLRNSCGVTAIEYAFVAALIAMVVIAGMAAVGGGLGNLWNALGDCMTSYGRGCKL